MQRTQTSNDKKYAAANQNPVVKWLLGRFFTSIRSIWPDGLSSVLDAGCGEGHALINLQDCLPDRVVGFDQNQLVIEFCRQELPAFEFRVDNIYDTSLRETFDLVMSLEVLEHLHEPAVALAELRDLSGQWVLLSVPFEPWFQIGNFFRGKYWSRLGNHPEHVQHWNPKTFRRFIDDVGGLQLTELTTAGPWIIALCSTTGSIGCDGDN
jgi:SAM-dependent methyltransferase